VIERNPNAVYQIPRYDVPLPQWMGGSMNMGGLNPAEANRLQRDLEVGGLAIMTEPALGWAGQNAAWARQNQIAKGARAIPDPATPEEMAAFKEREEATRLPPLLHVRRRQSRRIRKVRAESPGGRQRKSMCAGVRRSMLGKRPLRCGSHHPTVVWLAELRPERMVMGSFVTGTVSPGGFATRAAADFLRGQGFAGAAAATHRNRWCTTAASRSGAAASRWGAASRCWARGKPELGWREAIR
jgi:hypothetical protein